MPQQHSPGQLREGLGDVEITQRANLKEGHTQALRIGLSLLCGDLPFEGQVQAVSHQDFRNTGSVLKGERKARKMGYLCDLLLLAPWVCWGGWRDPQIYTDPELQNVSLFGNRTLVDVIS